jgi:hypothetical protein
MVVSPSPSHSFGIFVVRYNVVVVRELLVADRAYAILFGNFPLQKFPDFNRRSEFPISAWVMWIVNASNTRQQSPSIMRLFATAAAERFMDGAVFIATGFHAIPPLVRL